MTEMKILKEMPVRIPVNGTFELTVRCSLNCKMCLFRHDNSENSFIEQHELTAARWIDMAGQAAEAGTFSLLITGGEPMVRPDFCEIWEGIYNQGFIMTLYTNATMVTDEVMAVLRKYPPHRIGITIYGASADTYRRVCGSAAAFEKMIAGVHRLMELPSIFEFRTTIIKDNFEDFEAMSALVKSEFGREYFLTNTIMVNKAVRGACADVESCRLAPDETAKLSYRNTLKYVKSKLDSSLKDQFDDNRVYYEFVETESNPDRTAEKATLLGCEAGMSSFVITWDGQLIGCQMLGSFHTDAGKYGFKKAWEEYPYHVKLKPLNEKCSNCKAYSMCKSCWAVREAETKDPSGWPEYVCKVTKYFLDHSVKTNN